MAFGVAGFTEVNRNTRINVDFLCFAECRVNMSGEMALASSGEA